MVQIVLGISDLGDPQLVAEDLIATDLVRTSLVWLPLVKVGIRSNGLDRFLVVFRVGK